MKKQISKRNSRTIRGAVLWEVVFLLPFMLMLLFQHVHWVRESVEKLSHLSDKRLEYDGEILFSIP